MEWLTLKWSATLLWLKPPHHTKPIENEKDRLISKRARKRPFSTVDALRGNLAFRGHISTRTVIRRLHHQGMRARRPIKRPQLTLRHRHTRFDWSHDHLWWTIRTWRRVHWSDESRFLLRPTDGRARVWRQRNTKKCCTIRALCGLALSSINIGLSANAWLSKWGTTRRASTLSRYF
jgi:hypothetical protein